MKRPWLRHLLVLFSCLQQLVTVVLAQSNSTTDPQIVTARDNCRGVFLTYQITQKPIRIHPFVQDDSSQAYSFQSSVVLTNNGIEEVSQWEISIDFQYEEVIAEADGVLFLSGSSPPGLHVGNDTRIIGQDHPSLMTAIDTAEDETKISANFTIVGTEFGVNDTSIPLPSNITLINDGYLCGDRFVNGNGTVIADEMWVCCSENSTAITTSINEDTGVLPRLTGDITMTYDIMSVTSGSYWAQVNISLENSLGRVDHWNVSWEWQQGEFINSMKGAQVLGPNDQDACVFGAAATYYTSFAFENVMSCSPTPVIVDLSPDEKDGDVGIPHCCRNGSLLPALVDPTQTKSNFQLQVMKLPPHTAQDDVSPPVNWKFADGYQCSQPRKVSPTQFDPASPQDLHETSAVASWQVVCNLTQVATHSAKCCVSFSAYFNESLVPCPTCSCGCASKTFPWNGETCNPNVESMLLPYNAVLLPPSNRTALGLQLAALEHRPRPDTLACPDSCGVSLNWHVYSDYTNGWTARITLFNWDSTVVEDWFSAVELPNAMAGYQNVYSFNGSLVPNMNNTLFMEGRNNFNTFLNAKDSSDVPGKLQSIVSFDKRKTPGIQVTQGDGYPTKVWFNGDECAIPDMIPTGISWRVLPTFQLAFVLIVTCILLGFDFLNINQSVM